MGRRSDGGEGGLWSVVTQMTLYRHYGPVAGAPWHPAKLTHPPVNGPTSRAVSQVKPPLELSLELYQTVWKLNTHMELTNQSSSQKQKQKRRLTMT